jgi:hypothetical protein
MAILSSHRSAGHSQASLFWLLPAAEQRERILHLARTLNPAQIATACHTPLYEVLRLIEARP